MKHLMSLWLTLLSWSPLVNVVIIQNCLTNVLSKKHVDLLWFLINACCKPNYWIVIFFDFHFSSHWRFSSLMKCIYVPSDLELIMRCWLNKSLHFTLYLLQRPIFLKHLSFCILQNENSVTILQMRSALLGGSIACYIIYFDYITHLSFYL